MKHPGRGPSVAILATVFFSSFIGRIGPISPIRPIGLINGRLSEHRKAHLCKLQPAYLALVLEMSNPDYEYDYRSADCEYECKNSTVQRINNSTCSGQPLHLFPDAKKYYFGFLLIIVHGTF